MENNKFEEFMDNMFAPYYMEFTSKTVGAILIVEGIDKIITQITPEKITDNYTLPMIAGIVIFSYSNRVFEFYKKT